MARGESVKHSRNKDTGILEIMQAYHDCGHQGDMRDRTAGTV